LPLLSRMDSNGQLLDHRCYPRMETET
jgi:hypothetical protein